MFKLSLYTSEHDQRRALAQLEQQSVPIVLADDREFGEGFLDDYPLFARTPRDRLSSGRNDRRRR